jgi:hypothetical protein
MIIHSICFRCCSALLRIAHGGRPNQSCSSKYYPRVLGLDPSAQCKGLLKTQGLVTILEGAKHLRVQTILEPALLPFRLFASSFPNPQRNSSFCLIREIGIQVVD